MINTLLVGDYLFVEKYAYGYSHHSFPFGLAPFSGRVFGSDPTRGDVVRLQDADRVRRILRRTLSSALSVFPVITFR